MTVMDKEYLENYLANYVGSLRAIQLWFHSAHILAKGTGFAGDHVHLYGQIYNEVSDAIDTAIEKAVGITNDEVLGCPRTITYKALEVLMDYPVPTNAAPLKIALSALALVKSYIAFVEQMFSDLEEADELSLGLNDFLAQSANTFEGYAYLLQQRVKTEMDG
jgi:DNA-binding ferritin-like protein